MKTEYDVQATKRSIVFSAFWIFIALILLLTTIHSDSYSWLFNKKTADVNTESFLKVHAAEGLRMGYANNKFLTSPIVIHNVGNSLSECTSVDGKNIFFPLSEYTRQNYGDASLTGDGEAYNNANTGDFLFRKASANDKNVKYISVDFTLSSDITTGVWLSNDSQIIGSAKDAVRVSIYKNDNSTPIILDSSIRDYSTTQNVVSSITPDGLISSTGNQISNAIGNYSFTNENDGRQLFTIEAGKTIDLTLTIWLEGADTNCTGDILSTSNLSVNIKFVRDFENPKYIYFIDSTATKWIANEGNEMYVYDKNTEHTYKMTKSDTYSDDYRWIGKLPNTTEDVIFLRKASEDDSNTMSWDAKKCTGSSDEYYALGRGINGGYWEDSPTIYDIYFSDNTDSKWVSSEGAEINVSFSATDANNGTVTISYFMEYIGEHQALAEQVIYRGRTVSIRSHTFQRYVNGVYDGVNQWSGSRLSRTLYTITGSENAGSGRWSSFSG